MEIMNLISPSMILEANLAISSFVFANIGSGLFDWQTWFLLVSLFAMCSILSMVFLAENRDYIKVVFISACLGLIFSRSITNTISHYSSHEYIHMQFFLYLSVMSFFHYSEYLSVSLFNPNDLKIDAFLLTHSREYGVALFVAVLEMGLESYYLPVLKGNIYVICVGVLMIILGEFLRKLAMYTAGVSFTHMVATSKDTKHVLVTKGIYRYCRHPGYVGWTLWSIGTQVLLCNPLCFVVYICAVRIFYKQRIMVEEYHLIRFFGDSYIAYQKRVPTGLPFIYGLILEQT